jgi:hypothetical protein
MQEFLVLILVLFAGVYVFRRVKRTLTTGDGDRECPHCPVNTSKLKILPK